MPSNKTLLPVPLAPVPDPTALTPIEPSLVDDLFAGLAPTTVATYGAHLRRFARWLGVPWSQLPAAFLGFGRGHATLLVRRYRRELTDRGRAPATINTALAALQSLVALARAAERIDWTVDVPYLKARALRDTAGPGLPGVRALMKAAAAHPDPRAAARDLAIVRCLFDLALRRGELVGLDYPAHVAVDGDRPAGFWVKGKGMDDREKVTLPEETRDAVARWILARGTAEGPLFTSLAFRHRAGARGRSGAPAQRLTGRSVARLMERLAAGASLPRANPHSLRHTSITAALDAGVPLRDVQAHSRHAKADMVARYDDNRRAPAAKVARTVASLV